MEIIKYIKELDTQLFLSCNSTYNDFFDWVMIWASNKFIWIPFYLALFVVIVRKYQWKPSLIILLFVVALITLSDMVSVHLLKNIFLRYRPCHNLQLQNLIRTIDGCGGQYGFISSHATNVFALATFVGLLFRNNSWYLLLFAWAVLVAYSRVYLGVHYPTDVVGGMLVGIVMGALLYKLLQLLTPIGMRK